MLHPSYTDLIKVINSGVEEGEEPTVNSRYSIVIAASKRARQLIDKQQRLEEKDICFKPLSAAVDELNCGEVKILAEDDSEEEMILEPEDNLAEDLADESYGNEAETEE